MNAFDHKAWTAAGFKDFGDFADMVEYTNQSEYGDGQLEGEWYYGDDENRVLYTGTFGNYNSPGADSCTYAEQYATEEEYRAALAEEEAKPEYVETDDEEDEEEEEDDEDPCNEWDESEEQERIDDDDRHGRFPFPDGNQRDYYGDRH